MNRRRFLQDASLLGTASALGGLAGCAGGSASRGSAGFSTGPAGDSQPDLLASYWTIAGDVDPGTGGREWSLFDFRDRAEACARQGFKGMGLWHADVEHILERYSLADMKGILDDNGIVHLELEFLQLGGWLTGDGIDAAEAEKTRLLGWAEALGARHVKVGDFFGTPTTLGRATEVFAAVCADAQNAGTDILFEMMPFAMIDDFERSIAMCRDAGAPNGGVMVDTWHMMKMGVSVDSIAALPPRYLRGIELNDGWNETPAGMTLAEETVLARQFPGEGDWDMPDFMAACMASGFDGPYGVEVINAENRARSLDELAAKAYSTTASMFHSHT
jgi:sugar phosphate isomerase/epimerase